VVILAVLTGMQESSGAMLSYRPRWWPTAVKPPAPVAGALAAPWW
jgi:hypothetical protein